LDVGLDRAFGPTASASMAGLSQVEVGKGVAE